MKFMSCEEACRIVAGLAKDDVVVITMSTMKVFPGVGPQVNYVTCVPETLARAGGRADGGRRRRGPRPSCHAARARLCVLEYSEPRLKV